MTTLGIKTGQQLYIYPLTGLNSNMVLDRIANRVYVFHEDTGKNLSEVDLPESCRGMSFDEFIVRAQRFMLDAIESSN